MTALEIIALAVIALIVGAAVIYIVHSKKKGQKCIGCPNGHNCSEGEYTACSSCSMRKLNTENTENIENDA